MRVGLRVRVRHSNAFTGVQGEWNFNGAAAASARLQPVAEAEQSARHQCELTIAGLRVGSIASPDTNTAINAQLGYGRRSGRLFDTPFHSIADINRAGFDYQGDYVERSWAQTTVGYEFEDENGFVGDLNFPGRTPWSAPESRGVRATDVDAGPTVAGGGRPLCSQRDLRQQGRPTGGAELSGAEGRRDLLRHPFALLLCHRHQGSAIRRGIRQRPDYCSQSQFEGGRKPCL